MGGFAALDGTKLVAGSTTGSAQIVLTGAGADGSTESAAATVVTSGNNVRDSDAILINAGWVTASRSALLDIGIGAGPTWVINDLLVPAARQAISPNNAVYLLPFHVPSGVQVSARARITGVTAKSMGVICHLLSGVFIGGPGGGLSKVDAIGLNATAANARGTDVDPGASANTKSAFASSVLTTSCPRDIKMCYVAVGTGGQTANGSADWLVDIGVGAAGVETVLLPNLYFTMSNNIAQGPTPVAQGPFPCNIPAGTRIAARAQCGNTTTGVRQIDVMLIGIS